MTFDAVSPDAYQEFMGRWSVPLGARFVDLLAPTPDQRALDVGCGPGQLTAQLVELLGTAGVSAVDPSPSFVAAIQERFPELDVRTATAERLPFDDDVFDLAVCQLVVHFMTDPVAGLAEMGRVVRPGGTVAANFWDSGAVGGPMVQFWRGVHDLGLHLTSTGGIPTHGVARGYLEQLATSAGLVDVEEVALTVTRTFDTFDEWWDGYLLGVGPAGEFLLGLPDDDRARLRDRCHELLPDEPFSLDAVAWAVHARSA